MVKTVRCPSFARRVFTASELSGWVDGVDYGLSSIPDPKQEEKEKIPALSSLPIVQQNRILVGQPAKERSL